MYQQFLIKLEHCSKPLQDLVSLNQTALEALTNKQSALVSEIINDSISSPRKCWRKRRQLLGFTQGLLGGRESEAQPS